VTIVSSLYDCFYFHHCFVLTFVNFFLFLQLYDRISTKSVVGASGRHPPPDAWARARDVLECVALLQDASSRSQASSLSRSGSLSRQQYHGGQGQGHPHHHHMPMSRDLVLLQEILTSPHVTVSYFVLVDSSRTDARPISGAKNHSCMYRKSL
jgi:hypothetical protein